MGIPIFGALSYDNGSRLLDVQWFGIKLQRDIESEGGPFSLFTGKPDLPPVHFDQFFAQGQPESRPLLLPGVGVVDLLKFTEHFSIVFRGNPDSAIGNGNLHKPATSRLALLIQDR